MKKIRLVIADDCDEFRKSLVEHFSGVEEIEVLAEAVNGLDALDKVERYTPDVLLLDMVMPELDGFGVLKTIKEMGNQKPYTIILSQLATDSCVAKTFSLGANYYLLKPINFAALTSQILDQFAEKDKKLDSFVLSKNYARERKSLDEKLSNIFISVGIPAHIKGYQFLREAIKLAMSSPEMINSITKKLYPSIATQFETSSSKVERAIRHAIEVAWNRGKIENINNLFGMKVYGTSEKPTNGEFIALIADKMLIEGA